MAEELDLTDPVTKPEEVITSYKVRSLNLDLEGIGAVPSNVGTVVVLLKDNLGGYFRHQYEGQPAVDMIKWMNTADFSTNSMQKRVLQKLSNDGVLPGTVTGTPDPPAS